MNRLLLICLLSLIPVLAFAQQGNYKFNNYGNRSVILTGNVTGSVTDIGLTYYNPARLTQIESNSFAFNARAYQLNSFRLGPLVPGEEELSQTSFSGLPSAIGGTFTIFGQRFAYVALNRYRQDRDLGTSFNTTNEADITEPFSYSANFRNEVRDNWYGISWAKELKNGLGLGVSLFGAYYKYKASRSFNTILESNQRVETNLVEYSFDQRSYGFWVKVGAEYQIGNVDLGLNINLPYLEVINQGDYNLKQLRAGSSDNTDSNFLYSFDDVSPRRKYPWGISAGAGITINRSKIHVNIDYMSSLNEYERFSLPEVDLGQNEPTDLRFNEKRSTVVNFGIGGEIYLKENLQSFFGFSTDFNAYSSENEFFNFQTNTADEFNAGTDYFHISGGTDWEFKWGSIILGLTYTRGTNTFSLINTEIIGDLPVDVNSTVDVRNHKLQLVLGFEIPFIEKQKKSIEQQFNNATNN